MTSGRIVVVVVCFACWCAAGSGYAQPSKEKHKSPLARALALAQWDESRFAKFLDDEPLTVDERLEVERLVNRLMNFDRRTFASGAQVVTARELIENPREYRGQLIELSGKVAAVDPSRINETDSARFSYETLYSIVARDEAAAFEIDAPLAPDAWQTMSPGGQAIGVRGVFVKNTRDDQGQPRPLIAAPRIAWYPAEVHPPTVNFGMTVLGSLGVDVSLLDAVEQRTPLAVKETAAFVEMLDGMQSIGANQLVRAAERNMHQQQEHWREKLAAAKEAKDAVRGELAVEVVRQAEKDRYSVAPFFNEPASHVGELVMFDGVVRRCVRIVLNRDSAEGADAVDHYYELALFTDDSQDNPLIFCLLELPPGFPTGENLRESVRVAGFFFKSWRYSTRRQATDQQRKVLPEQGQQLHLAPMFIGRAPLRLVEPPATLYWSWLAGLGFAGLILIVWLVLWRISRSDRTFAERTLAGMQHSPPSFEYPASDQSKAEYDGAEDSP